MKILIICFGDAGDLLLTTPVLRCLKQQLNEPAIHYLLDSRHKAVLETNSNLSQFHFLDQNVDIVSSLKDENFDFVIDLQNDAASSRVVNLMKKRVLLHRSPVFRQFI